MKERKLSSREESSQLNQCRLVLFIGLEIHTLRDIDRIEQRTIWQHLILNLRAVAPEGAIREACDDCGEDDFLAWKLEAIFAHFRRHAGKPKLRADKYPKGMM